MSQFNQSWPLAGAAMFPAGPGAAPIFPQGLRGPGFPANGIWPTGVPFQQQNMFSNGFQMNSFQPMQQNLGYPIPFPQNMGPFQQQFNPSQGFPPSAAFPYGALNNFARPFCSPLPGGFGQNVMNQTSLGMNLPSQHGQLPGFLGGPPGGFQTGPSSNVSFPGNGEAPRQLNSPPDSGRGRKPFHRGVCRSGGCRGRPFQQQFNPSQGFPPKCCFPREPQPLVNS